jgi:hypothetical protein
MQKSAKGQLVEVGHDHYQFDEENDKNYFARLRDAEGNEKILWGVNIPKALEAAGVSVGDYIALEQREVEDVVIDAVVKDENGKNIGREKQEAIRYEWFAEPIEIEKNTEISNHLNEDVILPVSNQSGKTELGEDLIIQSPLQQSTEDIIIPFSIGDAHKQTVAEDTITVIKSKTTTNSVDHGDGDAQKSLKTLLRGRFIRDDQGNYRRAGEEKVALVDEGERIRFVDKQEDTFSAGVELVKSKGWDAIQVAGSEKFCSEAWFQAKKAGLEVIGYEPNEKDLRRLAFSQSKERVPNNTNMKDISASLHEAESFALKKIGGVQKTDIERGRYVGKLLHETDHHLVQGIGRGAAVIHEKSLLARHDLKEINFSKSVSMQYQNGRLALSQGRNTQRSNSIQH